MCSCFRFLCLVLFLAAFSGCQNADVDALQKENQRLKSEIAYLRQVNDSTRAHLEHGIQEAMFMEALELEEYGLLEESKKHFVTLIREYPNSNYARKAQLKLEELERLMKQGPKKNTDDKSKTPAPIAEKVYAAREFYALFEQDKEDVSLLFKNKVVTVVGAIKEVHDYSSNHLTNVELELRDEAGNDVNVSCNFSSHTERAKIKGLAPGAKVKVRGQYEFRFLNVPHLEDCYLAP